MRRLPRMAMPAADARRLVAVSVRVSDAIGEALRDASPRLLAVLERESALRADAPDAPAILEDAMARVVDVSDLERVAREVGESVSRQHRAQLSRQIVAAIGVDVATADPKIPTVIRHFADEYTGLIKGLPEEARRRASAAVAAAVSGGKTAKQLAAELEIVAQVSRTRAKFIARDQLGKLHGAVNRARQRELGVEEYTWRTSRDRRVRGTPGGKFPRVKYSHHAREGEVFRWDDPPPDGHPGEPVLCRCHAEPRLDHLLELDREVAPDTSSPQRAPSYVAVPIGLAPISGTRHRTIEVVALPKTIGEVGAVRVLPTELGYPEPPPEPPEPPRLYISPEARAAQERLRLRELRAQPRPRRLRR